MTVQVGSTEPGGPGNQFLQLVFIRMAQDDSLEFFDRPDPLRRDLAIRGHLCDASLAEQIDEAFE